MTKVNIDGCMFGLRSVVYPDKYIKKPWTLACTDERMLEHFHGYLCEGESEFHIHTACAGKDTKLTEDYTDSFASTVNMSFAKFED